MEWQSRAVQIAVLTGRPTRLVEERESFLMPSTCARPRDTPGGLLMYSVLLEPSPRPAAVMNDEMRARVAASRAAQGLSPVVEDLTVIERVAAVFRLVDDPESPAGPEVTA